MASESHELTEAEWRAVTAMRTAHAIIGGDPPAPYDVRRLVQEATQRFTTSRRA